MDVFGSRKPKEIRFSDHVTQLLTKVDYRRADSVEEREAAYRLRYKAYLREGTISANSSGTFSDPYDKTDNTYLFGLHIGGQLASHSAFMPLRGNAPSVPRSTSFLSIYNQNSTPAKSSSIQPALLANELLSRLHHGLPYATLRLCILAAEP